jgi:hypothetical protein
MPRIERVTRRYEKAERESKTVEEKRKRAKKSGEKRGKAKRRRTEDEQKRKAARRKGLSQALPSEAAPARSPRRLDGEPVPRASEGKEAEVRRKGRVAANFSVSRLSES